MDNRLTITIDLDMGAADGIPYIIYYKNKYKQTKEVKI